MLAQRVPPSACSTSQSMCRVRSPSFFRSTTARSERPISRWISCVRPLCLPRAASRSLRVWVERGSMPYSAVTQPSPLPFLCGGILSSTLAVHSTRVSPITTSTEPSACLVKPRVNDRARNASEARPLGREMADMAAVKKWKARFYRAGHEGGQLPTFMARNDCRLLGGDFLNGLLNFSNRAFDFVVRHSRRTG